MPRQVTTDIIDMSNLLSCSSQSARAIKRPHLIDEAIQTLLPLPKQSAAMRGAISELRTMQGALEAAVLLDLAGVEYEAMRAAIDHAWN